MCANYEEQFTENIQGLGVSVDWNHTYQTIEPRVQRVSQLSFVDLYEQGREYREKAPAIWCPECETAISQVETEDDEQDSHFHDIAFSVAGSDETFTISTTRPELLPACVAVFVHPDDDDNQHLVGESAEIPLFGHEVPILADEGVDMDTGSGIVMCCTFGDQNDIEWYQIHDLDLRVAIDESGHMTDVADEYEDALRRGPRGHRLRSGRRGALLDRRAITHTVNVHERCGTSVEFLVTEQWYIRMLDRADEYLEAGREMEWFPEKMFTRYKHWVEGLQWDWLISRQRSSGIPFPVWYCGDCDEPVIADKADLPVDPLSDDPPVDACPECGHGAFVPEEDVLDTWATSSLTPLINAGWDWDDEAEEYTMEHPELYRFDMRPQGHDIISFWLFHTVVKCYEHTDEVPFEETLINGMVLDENREAMSKSKGNVVLPREVLAEYPVDAARFWAAGSAVGDDLPYKEKGLRAGEKLLQKLWNASRLVESLVGDAREERPDVDHDDLRELDRWLLAELDDLTETLTEQFARREFSKARDGLRGFFWHTFCDDYLEVAKTRVREADDDDPAARYTLSVAHERFLKLFAPMLAHVTEELWQDMYAEERAGDEFDSIHLADWPEPLGVEADRDAGAAAMSVVGALRRYKSERGLPLNAALDRVEVFGEGDLAAYADDVRGVMNVGELAVLDTEPEVESVITGIDLDYAQVGPQFGETVGDIEAALARDDYEIVDGELHVAGETLGADLFAVERERRYSGTGELLQPEDAVVIVHDE
ncbi:valine--tRNA ligase [Halobaculum litoreum]|uniref:valine--tRNA ligase n=1 Tax=Halobaculum litoreum TaxID=3031998 RepID=A0ABD5XUJ4_9EURY